METESDPAADELELMKKCFLGESDQDEGENRTTPDTIDMDPVSQREEIPAADWCEARSTSNAEERDREIGEAISEVDDDINEPENDLPTPDAFTGSVEEVEEPTESSADSSDAEEIAGNSEGGDMESEDSEPISPVMKAPEVIVPEAPRAAPVRGRVFTEPAWKTAKLVKGQGNDQLKELEKSVTAMKEVIRELDRLMEERNRERDDLIDEIRRLEARPKPKPVLMALPSSPPPPPVQRTSFSSLEHPPMPPIPPRMSHSEHPPMPPPMPRTGVAQKPRFVADIQRPLGLPLGLRLTYIEKLSGFLVDEVKTSGSVPEWNSRSSNPITTGDVIVEINGIAGDRAAMQSEFSSSRVKLVIERPRANAPPPLPRPHNPSSSSVPLVVGKQVRLSAWPNQSVEAYKEILQALQRRNAEDQPRTGIMKYTDVPVRLPDNVDGSFRCEVCRVTLRSESEYVSHFHSQKHESHKANIKTSDLWSKCLADDGMVYWYEHTIGVWSIDDPGHAGTGSHTVIS